MTAQSSTNPGGGGNGGTGTNPGTTPGEQPSSTNKDRIHTVIVP